MGKRLLISIPTLLLLITIAFFLLRLAPGGPFDGERELAPEIKAALETKYNLDQSLPQQYFSYLGDVLTGDFGPSYQYRDLTVNQLLASALPVSLTLGGWALLVVLIVGLSIGMTAAVFHNRWLDRLLMQSAMVGISVPNFVVASLLILLFSVHLEWLPAGGWNNGAWYHLILPVVALALPFIAYLARLSRASMLEALQSDHIRTARAKGVARIHVILRHALPGALQPVIAWLGPAAVSILTGSVVIERVFGIPGIGRYFVQGALNRDYTLIMAVVIVVGVLVLLFNLLADVLQAALDPRVRQGMEQSG
ncbi:oligopeptide ABC transporter permease OppB [Marinicella sp. W31]|uniref:oligopeptide ABC transporter permease OppB n=1 Tax=Marinicella sp. W31 TaxID=3023713 RepID=UPI003757FA94